MAYDALERQRLGVAQHYVSKALAADLSAWYCYVAAARVSAARKDFRHASDALRTALHLLSDERAPRGLTEELERYEAELRAAAPVAPVTALQSPSPAP